MRARLKKMTGSQEFQFICAPDMAGKMDRVITFAGGVVQAKEVGPEGTVIRVRKAE